MSAQIDTLTMQMRAAREKINQHLYDLERGVIPAELTAQPPSSNAVTVEVKDVD